MDILTSDWKEANAKPSMKSKAGKCQRKCLNQNSQN